MLYFDRGFGQITCSWLSFLMERVRIIFSAADQQKPRSLNMRKTEVSEVAAMNYIGRMPLGIRNPYRDFNAHIGY